MMFMSEDNGKIEQLQQKLMQIDDNIEKLIKMRESNKISFGSFLSQMQMWKQRRCDVFIELFEESKKEDKI